MKLYPALLSMQNLFILICFCPPSCGHMFSDSSSMLELIQTILQPLIFNNAFRTRYQRLGYDITIHPLVKLLVDVAFPEQEREYNIKTAMLTTHYRQPQHQLPEFVLGRPRQVQATCIGNMEKAKKIKNDSIISMETDGCYGIKSNSGGTHTQLIFAMVFAHAKVLLYNKYLANSCLQHFHNQIGAGMISPNLSPTVSI